MIGFLDFARLLGLLSIRLWSYLTLYDVDPIPRVHAVTLSIRTHDETLSVPAMTHRPVLSYAAQFGKVGFASEVKWLPQVGTQNTLKGDYV